MGNMVVQCPLCDQYSGKPESVRAHISAKQDEAHRDESGFDYQAELGIEQDGVDPERDVMSVPTVDQDDAVEIRSVERDETEDGEPVVKLVLAGAALEGLSRAFTGQGLAGHLQDSDDDRDLI